MIVLNYDTINATIILEALELKLFHLLLRDIDAGKAASVAGQVNQSGFNVTAEDVQALARAFSLNSQSLSEAIHNKRVSPREDEEDVEEIVKDKPLVN